MNGCAAMLVLMAACLTGSGCGGGQPAPVKAVGSAESIGGLLLRLPARDQETAAVELTGLILNASEKDHPPRRSTVNRLSRGLVGAFADSKASAETAGTIEGCIREVLESAGTSTSGYRAHVKRFERALRDAKVPPAAQKELADLLEELGREVRGPEGVPVG